MKKIQRKEEEYNYILNQQLHFLFKSIKDFDNGDEIEAIRIAGHLRTLLHDTNYSTFSKDSKSLNKAKNIKQKILEKGVIKTKKDFNKLQSSINSLIDTLENQNNSKKSKKKSKSLLSLLNYKNIKFIDTSIKPRKTFAFVNFVDIDIDPLNYHKRMPYVGLVGKNIVGIKNKTDFHFSFFPSFKHKVFNLNIDFINTLNFDKWRNTIVFSDANLKLELSRKDLILSIANIDGYAHVDDEIPIKYLFFKQPDIIKLNFFNKIKEAENNAIFSSIRQIAFEVLISLEKANKIHKINNNGKTK